ncbi:MAG: TVP38/TMEM64 family protein [Thermoanaerobaculia bacterium]
MALARTRDESDRTPAAARAGWRLPVKIAAGLVVLAALVLLARFVPVGRLLEAFRGWSAAAGPWGGALYGLLYAAGTLLGVPAAAFSLGAGFLFGFAGGLAISVLSIAASAAAAWVLGRWIARARVERIIAARPRLAAVDGAIREKGWKVVALLRVNPVIPYGPLNYVLAASSVRFAPYMIGTVVGMLPDTLLYVALGSAGHLLLDPARRSPAQWALLGVGVAATAAATVIIARAARRRLAPPEKGASGGND